MSDWILAVDQGSHASRALLFDAEGEVRYRTEQAVSLDRGAGGVVEQDADEILDSVRRVIADAMAFAAARRARVSHAGLATQRSTLVLWDALDRRPLMPALHWQDTRFAEAVRRMDMDRDLVARTTGLMLNPHYGAPRLQLLLHTRPELRRLADSGRLRCAPLAAYLHLHLTGCDAARLNLSNAGRMLLLDLRRLDWSPTLLKRFGINRDCLPALLPDVADYGRLDGTRVRLSAVSGDQNAALFADGSPREDSVVINAGSGAFLLAPLRSLPTDARPLLSGVLGGTADGPRYLVEGTVNGAASALHWAADRLGAGPAVENLDLGDDAARPVFINQVGGLGSPWWRPGGDSYWLDAAGDRLLPQPAAGLAAVLESVVFMLCANLRWMRPQAPGLRRIRLSGGLSAVDGFCQALADLSGLDVERADQPEATARGVAWLAGGGTGWRRQRGRSFNPGLNIGLLQRYSHFLQVVESA